MTEPPESWQTDVDGDPEGSEQPSVPEISVPAAYPARALRDLLLRQLFHTGRDGAADDELHREVARTLAVEPSPAGFEISCIRRGVDAVIEVAESDFTFFARADVDGTSDTAAASRNERHAHRLALELLEIDAARPEQRERRRSMRALPARAGALVLPAAWIAAGGVAAIAPAILALAWGALDAVPRLGPLLAALPIASLAYAGAPRAAIAGGLVYTLFQALDPDPRLRLARVTALAAALGFALWLTPSWAVADVATPYRGAAIAAAAVAFALRWPLGVHRGSIALVLPFLGAGLVWDGRGREALAVLAVSLASTALVAATPVWVRWRRRRSSRRG